MNTIKLHVIAKDLKQDLQKCGTVKILKGIIDALKLLAEEPQKADQQKVSKGLQELYKTLEESRVEKYSHKLRQTMEEMGISREFGKALKEDVENIFERNQITPQIALNELSKIHEKITETQKNLNNIINGLIYFNIAENTLQKDECEFGLLIPRAFLGNNIENFGNELIKFEKILSVFSALCTGGRDSLYIKGISSSELEVFIKLIPYTTLIMYSFNLLIGAWKDIADLKASRARLAELEVPEEILDKIDSHITSKLYDEIKKITEQLLEEYGGQLETSRKNELNKNIHHSLLQLLEWIDIITIIGKDRQWRPD